MPLAHLSIGTTTDRVDLLDSRGFHAGDWRPQAGPTEDTFAGSSLADYRQLVSYREMTVVETIPLTLRRPSQNEAIESTQKLRQAITKAQDYWASSWRQLPVYLAARASCESEMRYAIIHTGAVPEDSNPYGEPFLQRAKRALMIVSLVVERGPWTDTPPGDASECVEIRGSQGSLDAPFYLDFDGINDEIDFGSAASLDDFPTRAPLPLAGAFLTAEAWIRADGYGTGGTCRIYDKCNASMASTGWAFSVSVADGLRALAQYTTTDAITTTGLDDFTADGQWHHVVAQLATTTWYIAIDGVWVTTYLFQQAGVGVYASDAANDLRIGNSVGTDRAFDGGIGWARISSPSRYIIGTDFTPPERCDFPVSDSITEGLWIQEGAGVTANDYSPNNNDGAITGAIWESDCEGEPFGQDATCLDQVYVANKHNWAQLTNIHYWDVSGAAWSANLIGAAVPFAFMPPTPLQVNDVVVFGSDTATFNSGPFCSLVFDIVTALTAGGGITIQWRYSRTGADIVTGPWPVLPATTLQDNTNANGLMSGDAFDSLGVHSVHWGQQLDWATFNPTVNGGAALGVTGYWVAAIVTASAGAPTPPIQQNRDIYSVCWPCVTIAENEIDGDMPAWLKIGMTHVSPINNIAAYTHLQAQSVYMGLRQTSRGQLFTPYINWSDEQNVPSVIVQLNAGGATFAAAPEAPTGRRMDYTCALAPPVDELVAYVRLFYPEQYVGRYHAFLRATQVAGAVGDMQVKLIVGSSFYAQIDSTPWKSWNSPNNSNDIIDMGELSIEPRTSDVPSPLSIMLMCRVTTVRTIYFFDLILLPVDEWAAQIKANENVIYLKEPAYLDGIGSPVLGVNTHAMYALTPVFVGSDYPELRINRDKPVAMPRGAQRLWFFATKWEPPTAEMMSNHEFAMKVQLWRQQRYKSMRGAH